VVKNNGGIARIKIEKNNLNKIRWFERPSGDIYFGKHDHSFSLPNNVVLERQ
jgi:hypothetical protein